MKYIKKFEGDSRYRYIRVKFNNFNLDAIIKYDNINHDYYLLNLNTGEINNSNYVNLILDFENSDLVKEPGNIWRKATYDEVEKFEISKKSNKYNL
jgi:hypothetical protein